MEITAQTFREAFPQFTPDAFSDSQIEFWLNLCTRQMAKDRWGELYQNGLLLLLAHNLTLQKAASTSPTGGMDAAAGPVIAKSMSAGGVSLSENKAGTTATANLNAGHFNDTIYGKQYWQLAQMIGAGGTVV